MDAQHTHAADLEATSDFLNTLSIDDGTRTERLAGVDDAVAFLVSRGLGHADSLSAQAAAAGEAWLVRVHSVRQALREVWEAETEHRTPGPAALDAVNVVLGALPRPQLAPAGSGCEIAHRHGGDPTGEALALLAEPLVAAVAASATERLRVCANDACRWAFEDRSRAGRRRWCDMSSCGNVAKARRYRARHKGTGVAVDPAATAGG